MRNIPTIALSSLLLTALLAGCMTGPGHYQGRDTATGGAELQAAGPGSYEVDMKDVRFQPATITVPAGSTVTWTNSDPMGHTVTPTDKDLWGTEGSGDAPSDWIPAGGAWSFTFDTPGTYDYYCLPHASQAADGTWKGMVGTVVVTDAAPSATGDASQQAAALAPSPDPVQTVDVPEIGADGRVPPPIDRDTPTEVSFEITAKEVVATMADGITYTYWTFDGQVPGPMLRVRAGDTVHVRFTNDPSSTMVHNIDFHAVTGPGGGAHALTAAPGDTAELRFKALNAGLYVYHCATAGEVPAHIGHGMYGMILVEPEQGLTPVDKEFYVVQGEFYSPFKGTEKGHHYYSADAASDEIPTFVTFNGRANSLTGDRALHAEVGETVRIYFGVGGPNLVSSFHVIGEIFDRVYDEGSLTSAPLTDVQTTLVPAGGATMVEFAVQVPGDYLLVDHSINRVAKGALGIIEVTGEEDPGTFDADPE